MIEIKKLKFVNNYNKFVTPVRPFGIKSSFIQASILPLRYVTTDSNPDMESTPVIINTLKIFEFSNPRINIAVIINTTTTPRTSGHGSLIEEFLPIFI